MTQGYFVTGTDTGVGKTLTACALLHQFAQRGLRAAGMKPVAAGAIWGPQGWVNDDVTALQAASNVDIPSALLNPYCFAPAIAPHIAARQAGVTIEIQHICDAFQQLHSLADVIVIEGAGGFCVPLNSSSDSADLAQRLGLPVILVVGMRLGCLNHALLTAQAIRARGLKLIAWIANRIDATMAVSNENVQALVERLDAPLIADIAYTTNPVPANFAALFDIARLVA